MSKLLQLKSVTKNYNQEKALDSVSIEVNKGDIVGLVGPNGAGKSTLMKIVTGLIANYNGDVLINDENIKNIKSKYKKVGCLIENPGYYGEDTGLDNLKFCAKLSGAYSISQIKSLAKLVGIDNALNKRVSQYSLGMKQKLGICMAMVGKPELLILDEPTNGLDPSTIPLIRDVIKYSADELNCGVLVSSHILSEIEAICKRVYFIRNGKIISEENIEQINSSIYSFSTDNIPALVECLKSNGYESTISNKKVDVKMDEKEAANFLKLAVSNNITILGMDKKKVHLEQEYNRIVEGKDE